jgi:hypothetical protein
MERTKTKRAARKVAVIDVFAVRVMGVWSPFYNDSITAWYICVY